MIVVPYQLAGRYRLTALRPDGRRRPLADWFDNLILDRGLDEMASNATWLDCCQVGGSAAAEAPSQTALLAPIAGSSTRVAANSRSASAPPWFSATKITYRFTAGQIVGQISELGIGSSATLGSPLFSRALIKDIYGNPNPGSVLADEALDVDYELGIYAPDGDITGTAMIDGVAVGYTARPALVTTPAHWAPYRAASYASAGQAVRALFAAATGTHMACFDGVIGAATSQPGGSSAAADIVTPRAYVAGSRRVIASLDWNLTTANFAGGIRSLLWRLAAGTGGGGNSLGAWQVQFATPVLKTAQQSFGFDVGISWGRR